MKELRQQVRFMVIGIVPKGTDNEVILKDLEELEALIKTIKGEIFAITIQKAEHSYRDTVIGSGKTLEVAEKIIQEKIDIVVINNIVKPKQLFALEKIFQKANPKIKVWDRVDLILEIFSQHANTKEAKLQIELARLRHLGPRAYGMGQILSKQGSGIGSVGSGETNTELMKRHWRHEMKHIEDQLTKLSQEKEKQISQRRNIGYLTCAIVGYTNAGKTLLFNCLTNKKNFVDNMLFATLDSSTGKLWIPEIKKEIIITDTIGFIKKLPPNLIDAFKSTLLESINCDLLLIVTDVSDPQYPEKIDVVEKILAEIKLSNKKCLYIFNKIDNVKLLHKEELIKKYATPLFISAKTKEGIDNLIKTIGENIIL